MNVFISLKLIVPRSNKLYSYKLPTSCQPLDHRCNLITSKAASICLWLGNRITKCGGCTTTDNMESGGKLCEDNLGEICARMVHLTRWDWTQNNSEILYYLGFNLLCRYHSCQSGRGHHFGYLLVASFTICCFTSLMAAFLVHS